MSAQDLMNRTLGKFSEASENAKLNGSVDVEVCNSRDCSCCWGFKNCLASKTFNQSSRSNSLLVRITFQSILVCHIPGKRLLTILIELN